MEHGHYWYAWALAVNVMSLLLALSEPVDVYSEWIDACEAANENADKRAGDDEESEEDD